MSTVAITGAGRGIGLEMTRQHLAAGDTVIALVRDPAGATKLNALADGTSGKLIVQAMDVGDEASIKAAAAAGTDPVDIVYNVAGVVGPVGKELEIVDGKEWDEAFNILVQGPLRVLIAFLPRLPAGSKVMNISSQLAASTWPYGGMYAYAGAKAALNRVMRSAAIDLKDKGVIVGLIHPGYVKTDMGGENAEITPEESASGIIATSKAWTLDQSGDFYKWNGEVHPW